MEEGFNYMNLVWAVLPLATAALGGLYVSWKAKVAADGVQDWKDEVVKAVDGLMEKSKADAK